MFFDARQTIEQLAEARNIGVKINAYKCYLKDLGDSDCYETKKTVNTLIDQEEKKLASMFGKAALTDPDFKALIKSPPNGLWANAARNSIPLSTLECWIRQMDHGTPQDKLAEDASQAERDEREEAIQASKNHAERCLLIYFCSGPGLDRFLELHNKYVALCQP